MTRRTLPAAMAALLAFTGCFFSRGPDELRVAAPDSLVAVGLVAELAKRFERGTGVRVTVRSMRDLEAFEAGRKGDADLVFGHSPAAFERLRDEGKIEGYVGFAENDYLIAGPPEDPAKIRDVLGIAIALRLIASAGSTFVSRGDGSGTAEAEQLHWTISGAAHDGPWYVRTGKGMAQTVREADRRSAYVFVDRATFALLRPKLRLEKLFPPERGLTGAQRVQNIVLAIAVKRDGKTSKDAWRFLEYLSEDKTESFVESFKPNPAEPAPFKATRNPPGRIPKGMFGTPSPSPKR